MTIRATLAALALVAGTTVTPGTAAAHASGVSAAAACAGASDFDGDGADDVAVGDPFADDQKGAVHVLSGGKVVPVGVPGLARGDGFGCVRADGAGQR
ncbi:hypothetical protein GCM10020220_022630 [Nonomuraea rubra]